MNPALHALRDMQAAGWLRPLDVQLADLADRMVGERADASLLLAVALASHAVGEGHPCIDLAAWAGRSLADLAEAAEPEVSALPVDDVPRLPPLADWLQRLTADAARPVIGAPAARTLLVLAGTRLYLRRYWRYEQQTARHLQALARPRPAGVCSESSLARYFPDDPRHPESVRLQREAARSAVTRGLTILSGGPGTGKTYLLARTVALLAEGRAAGGTPLQVRIAAPTGKAAKRVVESLRAAKEQLRAGGIDAVALAAVPETAVTIHRLLGSRYASPDFKHDARHPLAADLVVIDEASMIDLPLMAKLLDALPEGCRLMLVGDSGQLASVGPGRVFGDICRAARAGGPLTGCLTELTESRRFPAGSAIARVSGAIQQSGDDALAELKALDGAGELTVHDSGEAVRDDGLLDAWIREHFREFLAAETPSAALEAAGQCRILCALRRGPWGVERINHRVERQLAAMGLRPSGRFYDHQLVLITVNTPALGLDNGDVGVVLTAHDDRDDRAGRLLAWFPDRGGTFRSVPVNLLPGHETAFAMTVHKSQGSEFPHVALVLPPGGDSPVLTRELLYTGLTRVRIDGSRRGGVTVFCTDVSFRQAADRPTRRESGLFLDHWVNVQP